MEDLAVSKSADILVIVNVSKTLDTNSLAGNIWLADSKTSGSNPDQQDQAPNNELRSQVLNGGKLTWTVVAIDPDDSIAITAFTGEAIDKQVIHPQAQNKAATEWRSDVNAQLPNNQATSFQYAITFEMGDSGRTFSWDPFFIVNPA